MDRTVQDALDIMRLVISRRNQNDPDALQSVLLDYLSDFVELTMSDDVKLFEQWGTLVFDIAPNTPDNDGVYSFKEVGLTDNFVNESMEAFIADNDLLGYNWNPLNIYQNPFPFFNYWGPFSIGQDPAEPNNTQKVLVPGFPTWLLIYDSQLTFRTVPQLEHTYKVKMFCYKKNQALDPTDTNAPIPQNYWLRYWAWGAALNYARDFRFAPDVIAQIKDGFQHEKKLLLTRTHNQIKQQRTWPNF